MKSTADKLKEIKELEEKNSITRKEYEALRDEILHDESVNKFNKKQNNTEQMQNYSVQRIKHAGSNAMGIFYCIIFQILVIIGYWFLIGFKIGYSEASGQTENIGSFLEYIKNLNYMLYFIEFIIALLFMLNLFYLGVNLKNVDKKPN